MDSETQAFFDNILQKDITALTEGDIIFLRARRSYLNPEQEEKYKDFIKVEEKISYKTLMEHAKGLGLKVRVGLKREQLEQMIADAE